jgi:hypothetical protein
MYRLTFLFSALITLTINAKAANSNDLSVLNSEFITLETNLFDLELDVFAELSEDIVAIEDIEVVELEEDIEIDFDTTQYLPKNFNILLGKNDIDWSNVELVELEEDVELYFNTKDYLPENFNPYEGLNCKKDVVVCLY